MPGYPDQCPILGPQTGRHVPGCAKAYPSPLAPPPLPPLPVILFHPVTFLITGHLLPQTSDQAPSSLEKYLPCLLLGKFQPTLIKSLSYRAHSLPRFGSPTPVTQVEAKVSQTLITVAAVKVSSDPQDPCF